MPNKKQADIFISEGQMKELKVLRVAVKARSLEYLGATITLNERIEELATESAILHKQYMRAKVLVAALDDVIKE